MASISLNWLTWLTPLILLGGALFWVLNRTVSLHVVRLRLWQLAHGSQPVADERVRTFIETQTSLAAFQAIAGVNVSSLAHAHDLLDWCCAHEVPIQKLRLCRDYFDGNTRQLKPGMLPRWLAVLWNSLCLGAAVLCAMVGFLSATQDTALLSWKGSGRHFAANASMAKPPWPWQPRAEADVLRSHQCEALAGAGYRHPYFRSDEARNLCTQFAEADGREHLANAVREWRWTVAIAGFVSLVFASSALRNLLALIMARRLALRRLPPDIAGRQLSFDFHDPFR